MVEFEEAVKEVEYAAAGVKCSAASLRLVPLPRAQSQCTPQCRVHEFELKFMNLDPVSGGSATPI